MKLIFHYMGKYRASIALGMALKLLGTLCELMIPYILEHLIDEVVPLGRLGPVLFWGVLMILTALVTRQINVWANRRAVENAHNVSYDVRQDLFTKTANLSGSRFDALDRKSVV